VWLIPVLIVGLVVVGASGWFALSLLSGGTQSSRAKAQAEAVADLYESFSRGDGEMLKRVLPEDLADLVDEADLTVDDTLEVSREWDGDTLVLTVSSEEYDWESVVELTGDGDKDSAVVTAVSYSDGEEEDGGDAIVEREGKHWVVVELDGTPIRDALGLTDDSEGGDDSDADYGDEAQQCWENQRTIEGAAQQYYAAEAENEFSDITGEVFGVNWLLQEDYLNSAPTCPYDDSYYYLFDDGTTGCPSGMHGYYADEQ
jgi:type II secretory pathway pseudopilin PulG